MSRHAEDRAAQRTGAVGADRADRAGDRRQHRLPLRDVHLPRHGGADVRRAVRRSVRARRRVRAVVEHGGAGLRLRDPRSPRRRPGRAGRRRGRAWPTRRRSCRTTSSSSTATASRWSGRPGRPRAARSTTASSRCGRWSRGAGRPAPARWRWSARQRRDAGFGLGDTVKLNANGGSREFTLVGIVAYNDIASPGNGTWALFDEADRRGVRRPPGLRRCGAGARRRHRSRTPSWPAACRPRSIPDVAETLTRAQITDQQQDEVARRSGSSPSSCRSSRSSRSASAGS